MLLLGAIRCIAASAAIPECAMSPLLQPIRLLAAEAARLDAVLTADLIVRSLSFPPSTALEAAHLGVAAGLFRARKLPGHGNHLVFQPTARAAGLAPAIAPLSLRRAAPPDTLRRSLIRGSVRYGIRPDLSYLTRGEVSALYRQYGVPTCGHAPALVGLDGAHFHLFQPVINEVGRPPTRTVETTIARHFLLLESGCATLHFTTFEGGAAEAMQAAIAAKAPVSAATTARVELTALDAEVAADRTGLRRLDTAGRRAALTAKIEAAEQGDGDLYPWLDRDVVGVTL